MKLLIVLDFVFLIYMLNAVNTKKRARMYQTAEKVPDHHLEDHRDFPLRVPRVPLPLKEKRA